MNKLVMLLAFILVFSFTTVLAESIDFSEMSNDEVSSLYNGIREEMFNRGIARSGELCEGEYVVGKDIAPGAYNISSTDEYYSTYYLFTDSELYAAFKELQKSLPVYIECTHLSSMMDDGTTKIDLKEGDVLLINYNGVKLEELKSSLMP